MAVEQRELVLPQAERRLALVIGVNRAPGAQTPSLTTKLKACEDAEAIATVLQAQCGFTLLFPPLLDEEATSDHVRKAVLALARDRTEQDFLLLYFAGHGHPMAVSGGQHDIYLVTHDFYEREVAEDEQSHRSMSWLRDKLYLPTGAQRGLFRSQGARSSDG